jgi:hypothetical protein
MGPPLDRMRQVDVSAYRVVRAGIDCTLSTPLQIGALAAILERHEEYIFWLQPLSGGVRDQIAAVSVNGILYHPNLRIEKAVFRRVRLSRAFDDMDEEAITEDVVSGVGTSGNTTKSVRLVWRIQDCPRT